VPWVLVNGVPLLDDFENVATFICAAYSGYPKCVFACLRWWSWSWLGGAGVGQGWGRGGVALSGFNMLLLGI